MSWELPVLTTLILSVLGFWWLRSPQSTYQKVLYALLCGLTILVNPRHLLQHIPIASYDTLFDLRLDVLLVKHFKMALTLGAVVWLLHRSLQTLWKPVPDLINILGVDVPESPDVSLAGIRADAATLSWTRPPSNRPVQKYSIQVNGVHVGDSPGNEVAITVTGLKPNHFYNIRVVAVGPNNFQAGSPVVRLRTFGKDGKPQLGNSRLPTSFTDNDQPRLSCDDEGGDSETHRHPVPSVEAAPVLDGSASGNRDLNGAVPAPRRNTINRRHSPSVASTDQPQTRPPTADGPEMSLDELNRKFEGIRKEIDDTLSLYAKDEADFKAQEEELKVDKDSKRLQLKEKEERTAQLKAQVRATMEQMRAAEKEKAKKEQQLKDKETKKARVRDAISKLEHDVERMKKDGERFESQKTTLKEKRDADVNKLDESNAELQEKCTHLEAELKEKGKQLQDLKAAREQLPGGDDEQWKESDAQAQREWDARRKELHNQLVIETKKGHQMDQHLRLLADQLAAHAQSSLNNFYNPTDATGLDFDPLATTQLKRHSQNSNTLANANLSSSPDQFSLSDSNFPASTGFSRAAFGPGLFMDLSADRNTEHPSEADLKANSGPLSPTAHALLPSDIFDETESSDARAGGNHYLPESIAIGNDEPQSPASSGHSRNFFSSPHGSSHNLPFPPYVDSEPRIHNVSSPSAPRAAGHRFTSLLSNFQRNRGPRPGDEDGPAIGTLKPGQSQSFPRGADEHEASGGKRRLSFSWMNRHSAVEGARANPVNTPQPFSTRRLFPFANSSSGIMSERDHGQSRPASIASTELPRPSTDSGSIWGPGDISSLSKHRFWSPNDAWVSRSNSRRPSIHGSPAAMTTTLASADDEILLDDDLMDPQTSPSQIGVIGSRLPASSRALMNQRLNPTAPTFMGNIFERDRDGETLPDEEMTRALEKDRSKEKAREDKHRSPDAYTGTHQDLDDSPYEPRMSRDGHSISTRPSVSESRESLPLDAMSNSTSEMNSSSYKDSENVVRKLFRKGSSSKFSFSSRLGKESGLFKKGPGSATYSDKNMSADHRSSIGDLDDLGEDISQLGRSYDSVTSSPSIGPPGSKGKDKEGRMSGWRFSIMKKGKDNPARERESLDLDRAPDEE